MPKNRSYSKSFSSDIVPDFAFKHPKKFSIMTRSKTPLQYIPSIYNETAKTNRSYTKNLGGSSSTQRLPGFNTSKFTRNASARALNSANQFAG